ATGERIMNRPRGPRGLLPVVLVLLLTGGCGDADGRQKVSGTVALKGQPVDAGHLEFIPMDGGGSHAGATIENGKYTIPADKGLLPGNYTVKVYWPDLTSQPKRAAGETPGPGDDRQIPKNRMPPKYNSKTTLTREVKKGANTIDFLLD